MTSDGRRVGPTVLTPRLEVRAPTEDDRSRFVKLFGDDSFMVFSGGPLAGAKTHDRFDRVFCNAGRLTFTKQP